MLFMRTEISDLQQLISETVRALRYVVCGLAVLCIVTATPVRAQNALTLCNFTTVNLSTDWDTSVEDVNNAGNSVGGGTETRCTTDIFGQVTCTFLTHAFVRSADGGTSIIDPPNTADATNGLGAIAM